MNKSVSFLKTAVLSSLHKAFPQTVTATDDYTGGTCFQNESFSFQIAYRNDESQPTYGLNVSVSSDLPCSVYRVDYVPAYRSVMTGNEGPCENFGPGLYPDILMPRQTNSEVADEGFPWESLHFEVGEKNVIQSVSDCWQSLWVTINEDGGVIMPTGKHTVTVTFTSRKGNSLLAECSVEVEVLPACLPSQSLLYTNWLHSDCLSDLHCVPLFGDAFFEVLEDYARKATWNGMNTVFLPAFTPALDVSVGKQRRTQQLVGVTADKKGDKVEYHFDFSLVKRYIDACRRGGTTHFEHCHLFSQWGAKTAVKVMVTMDGEEVELFGWHTPATSQEYGEFLAQYLPAFRAFMKEQDLDNKVLYHISDEPSEEMAEAYAVARAQAIPYLEGCLVTDAMSHYALYEKGLTKAPIIATNHMDDFIGKCDSMWCYYTGEQVTNNLSNRSVCLPSYRNRILGMQMYRYDIKGFLNWNYNYCYSILSHGVFDPCTNIGCYGNNPSGPMVYPGRDGTALQSIRLKVFADGITDMRALQLLEQHVGRPATEAFLDSLFGDTVTFNTCPTSAEQLLAVREAINAEIAKYL